MAFLNFFKTRNGLKVFGRAEIDGSVTSTDVLPVCGDTYSIGSSGSAWEKGYFSESGIDLGDNVLDVQNGIQDTKWLFFNDEELATYSTVLDVSASFTNQIQNIDVTSQLSSLSGDIYALITEVSGNLYTLVADTSGYLQTEIDDNRTEVITVSGNLYTLITNTSAANYSELVSVSGNLYTTIANTSGYLQSEIIALSATDTILSTSISGLSNHFINAEITGISGVWTQVSCVPIAATNKVTWELVAIDEDDVTHRYASTVSAIHNGSTGVSWAEYAVLYTGTQTTLQVRVTNDGTTMCLEVSE